ncbi:cyclic nucleotide-binding domain-containing protein [Chitinophaga niabensis]|uniref:Crp/Fnr family transcriptional regulator n=1 Tax=Chitinophaga niabensis TaxID=536979 RepID=UPI0031BB30BB
MENLYHSGYDALYTRINQIQPHPEELKKDIIQTSTIVKLDRKDIIVRPGEISRHSYFIIDGFVRIYRDHGRKESTTWFLNNNDFMLQVHGSFFGNPSPEYLQATDPTTCIKMHIDDQEELFRKYPMFFVTYTKLIHIYYTQLIDRDSCKALSAKEKYLKLLEEYPYIIQKAQSAHIASYFGISETYYSKIKNNRV